ncbi:MAG: class F sortase [Patescibacteria group bacterium]
MLRKISLKKFLFVAGAAGVVIFVAVVSLLYFDLPGSHILTKEALFADGETPQDPLGGTATASVQNFFAVEEVRSGLPARIKIPAINVDAAVEQVGLTPQWAMDVPKGPDRVAWFKLGPRPGEEGSSVIAGHFGWKDDIPAVFDDLHILRKGDKIYIEEETGAITVFVVRTLRTFNDNENTPDVFGSTDGKAHLNLVTCQGSWNKEKKSYSQRLVVFTDKETE